MPELPEVETVKQTLEEKIAGLRFTGVKIYHPGVVRMAVPGEMEQLVPGKKITGLNRRGKYLLVHLEGNITLVIHLRMTGRLVYMSPAPPVKHTHVLFTLENGMELHFVDTRRFGRITCTSQNALHTVPGLKDLGVEPLGSEFSRDFLRRELRSRRTKLKNLLLDQAFIAGLGNIYVDEALHRARLHPERVSNTLNPREVTRLYHAIINVLKEGIRYGGTTFRDYVDGSGRIGNFQEHLRVYGREGRPCPGCKTGITRLKISGRSSYFCPNCQKSSK